MAVKEQTKEQVTFKIADPSNLPYHVMVLTVGPYTLADGTINGDMADGRVQEWIASGYTIKDIHFLGKHQGAGGQGEFLGFQFAYHFVKNDA